VQLVAVAILHSDDPKVFLAEDMDVLHWVLALQLVATTDPRALPAGTVEFLKQALLEERWGDAVVEWMTATGNVVDVFPSWDVFTQREIEMAASELQFTRLFGPRDDSD
jgi:hypothetical protein